jgi:hypothetical protein
LTDWLTLAFPAKANKFAGLGRETLFKRVIVVEAGILRVPLLGIWRRLELK